MMLTPADLDDEGLEGHRLAWGGTDTLDDEYATLISSEESADETIEVLEEAGFVQSRWTMLDLPSEDDPDLAARRLAIFIDEYTGSDEFSDVIDIYLGFGTEIEETSETIGDASFMTTYTDSYPDTGVDTTSVVVVFQYENQIGQINISDYATQLPDIEPTTEEIEALAERQLDRMIDVRDDGSTGIEHQLLRFDSDGQFVYYNADYYTRIDDEISPRYGQDVDLLEGIDEAEQSFGMTDAYRLVQTIGSNGETYVFWGAQVRLFDDEDGAADWVGSAADWLETIGAEGVEEIDADLALGDETAVASYVSGSEDAQFYTIAIFVQVGDIGIVA
jgi:hypothetical protein